MQFTPQQLSGAGKYASKTLIGNWQEDGVLDDLKRKSLAHRRATGPAAATPAGSRAAVYSSSGAGNLLRYGDVVGFRHRATGRALASNVGADGELASTHPGVQEFQASGAPEASLRTSFVVLPADCRTDKKEEGKKGKCAGDTVNMGDEVLLATEPTLRVDGESGLCQRQLYVTSTHASVMGSSSHSGQQEVRLALLENAALAASGANLRWRLEPLLSKPAKIGADCRVRVGPELTLQLVHCASGKAMAMDQASVLYNNYGPELDVFCCLHQQSNRVYFSTAEARGTRTGDHRLPVQSLNEWFIETRQPDGNEGKEDAEGKGCAEQEEVQSAPCLLSFESVLAYAQSQRRTDELAAALSALDGVRDGVLDRVDVKYAFIDAGLRLSHDELACLLDGFQDGNNGPHESISIATVLAALATNETLLGV